VSVAEVWTRGDIDECRASAVVVLIDEGSPLQVTLAVLVSGWAHVLHAMYKPWGGGSVLYILQHGALFVTSFVFLMGLLFKVDGVSSASGTYSALSGIMMALCVAFMAAWVAVIVWRVAATSRKSYQTRRQSRPGVTGGGDRSGGSVASGVDGLGGGVAGDVASASSAVAVARTGVEALVTASDGSTGDGDDRGSASLSPRRPDGFVVVNPLRHVKSDAPRAVAVAGVAHGAADPHTARGDARTPSRHVEGHGGADAGSGKPVAVSRLQRVLTAQQPVPASTR
jgi:hypothetical protein